MQKHFTNFFLSSKATKAKRQTANKQRTRLKTENGKWKTFATLNNNSSSIQTEGKVHLRKCFSSATASFWFCVIFFVFFLREINQQMGFQFPINTPRQK